ncbi:MAG: cupin domain-containing protein [Spirosomataceae bacterium]
MQKFNYPHTIDNGAGEVLSFVKLIKDPAGDWLEVENCVSPGSGPPMHVHFKQAESLTVVKGKMGVQLLGQPEEFYGEGQSITFKAGEAHRFWNAGNDPLECKGWIKPAHNVEYFLTEIYKSVKANGGKQPDSFDGAYLMTKYRTEFDMSDIPTFVKKVIFPITLFFGKLAGKHKKFADAPEAIL